jgi:hypothetical protein
MYFSGVARKIGESLSNPATQAKIGDVARGISRLATLANKASGGLLQTAVEAVPFGSTALKASKYGLEHAGDIAKFLGRTYQRMSSAPK